MFLGKKTICFIVLCMLIITPADVHADEDKINVELVDLPQTKHTFETTGDVETFFTSHLTLGGNFYTLSSFSVGDIVKPTVSSLRMRSGPGTSYTEIDALTPNSRLEILFHSNNGVYANNHQWWYVKNIYGTGVGWVAGTYLEIVTPDAPDTPALISPAKNDLEVSTLPTFRWQSVSNVDYYKLLIHADYFDTDLLIFETTATTYTLPAKHELQSGKTHAWSVIAYNEGGNSGFETRGFITKSDPLPDPAYFEVRIVYYDEVIQVNEETRIECRITNSGGQKGTQTIYFYFQNSIYSKSVTLDAGEQKTIFFYHTATEDDVGYNAIALDSNNDEHAISQAIEVIDYEEIEKLTVTLSASPPAGGTVPDHKTVEKGSSVTVTASAFKGYTFKNWTENSTVVSEKPVYTFTIWENRSLVANFIEDNGGKVPAIDFLDPVEPNKSSSKQSLTILGQNFVSGLKVILESPESIIYTIPNTDNDNIYITPNRIELSAVLYTSGKWNLKVINPGGEKSSVHQFNVAGTDMNGPEHIEPPEPSEPGYFTAPGEEIHSLTPVLNWHTSPDADYYSITVKRYPYNENNVIYKDSFLTGASHQLPAGTLDNDARYCWSIRAVKDGKTSVKSETLFFYTTAGKTNLHRVVTTSNLFARENPGIAEPTIELMLKGSRGKVIGGPITAGNYRWLKIEYDVGITGWSAGDWLISEPSPPSAPYNFASWAEDSISWAKKWQQDNANNTYYSGLCLRFVSNAFMQKHGEKAGLYNAISAATLNYRFDQEDKGWLNAPRGALIYFNRTDTNKHGHVGIYTGNGNIIHAHHTVKTEPITNLLAAGHKGIGPYIGWGYPLESWSDAADEVLVEPEEPFVPVSSKTVKIPEKIKVYHGPGDIRVHNMENYLLGVVTAEMGPEWVSNASPYGQLTKKQTMEALKAQAIAARTYAAAAVYGMWTRGRSITKGEAHIMVGEYDQDWRPKPAGGYHSLALEAVEKTEGMVITHNSNTVNGVIRAFYSTYFPNNAGLTRTALQAGWSVNYPYLQPVACNTGLESGTCLPPNMGIPLGHGVGMSQLGAINMASGLSINGEKQLYNYQQIIEHYYTGARVVKGKYDSSSETYAVHSPASIRVYDSLGRVTGLINGVVKNEIPDSFYNTVTKEVTISNPQDDYEIELHGYEDGDYKLTGTTYAGGESQHIEVRDVQTQAGAVHKYKISWDDIKAGQEGVAVKIDQHGDGSYEYSYQMVQPFTPVNVGPVDHEKLAETSAALRWKGSSPAQDEKLFYEIYLGNTQFPSLVETIGPVKAEENIFTFNIAGLDSNSTYYWKIVARSEYGITTESPIWQFTTGGEEAYDFSSSVYWQNNSSGLRYLWFMDGHDPVDMGGIGKFGAGEWNIVSTGDLNGNGRTDLVWHNENTGLLYAWLMEGLKKVDSTGLGTESHLDWKAVALGDINGSGSIDVIWENSQNGSLAAWFLDGTENAGFGLLPGLDPGWTVVGAADMNSSGHTDLIVQNVEAGEREVWLMESMEKTGSRSIGDAHAQKWQLSAVGDFNGNGHPDLVWTDTETGLRYVEYMENLERTGGAGIGTVANQDWEIKGIK